MNTLADLTALLIAPFDLVVLRELAAAVPLLLWSFDPIFLALFVLPFCRFVLPDICIWVAHTLSRSRRTRLVPARQPLVSVVIAGCNEAAGIAATIRSVLNCGYPHLEIIYVDDGSQDDSVRAARRVAQAAGGAKVRVFEAARRSGKPSALNIGIAQVRGEFIAIIDADCDLQYGSIQHWLVPFADARMGAVAANLRVRNSRQSWLTRLQECEYALNITLSRFWRSRIDFLSIVPGAGGMFRAEILKGLGGFDTGLGDDTDMTLKLRKQGWRLGFALQAVVWTDVPVTSRALLRQRTRWERNMVKIRLRKHGDMMRVSRFGLRNMLMLLDLLLVRIVLPAIALMALAKIAIDGPAHTEFIVHMYWLSVVGLLLKLMIARDIASTPQPARLVTALILPFYRVFLRTFLLIAVAREALRLGQRHAYVPPHIWRETPHW